MTWLTQLFDRITSFIPRIQLVDPDEAGIRITLGSRYRLILPGWYIYWPLLQKCVVNTITPQIVDLRAQSVWTADGHDVTISGAIQYRITDVAKAILVVQDFDKSLDTLALGIIRKFTGCRTLEQCHDQDALITEILKGIRDKAAGWGLKIMDVFITDNGSVKNIRLLSNEMTATPVPIGEKEE